MFHTSKITCICQNKLNRWHSSNYLQNTMTTNDKYFYIQIRSSTQNYNPPNTKPRYNNKVITTRKKRKAKSNYSNNHKNSSSFKVIPTSHPPSPTISLQSQLSKSNFYISITSLRVHSTFKYTFTWETKTTETYYNNK